MVQPARAPKPIVDLFSNVWPFGCVAIVAGGGIWCNAMVSH